MTIKLSTPALRRSSPEKQQEIIDILTHWPDHVKLSKGAFHNAWHEAIDRLIQAWNGSWLNPHDYNSRNIKLQCQNGHIWHTQLVHLTQGNWCSQCNLLEFQKNALEKIKKIAEQRGGQCLSEQYIGSRTPLTFRCNYGHTWQTSSTNIKTYKRWCAVCNKDKTRYPLDQLHALAAKFGGTCLTKTHTLRSSAIQWQCAKGHKWASPASRVEGGSWCSQCAFDKQRASIEELHEIAKSRGGKCLSTHYQNARVKMLWECDLGHQWQANSNNIKRRKWCPMCANLARCKYDETRKKYLPSFDHDSQEL
ncbi:MAG: hypothetical protein ACRCWR_09095 [Saezia sp.]